MVILIGGASCSGKTTMAQRLLEKYQIPYLSIDHVKMGIIRSNPDCGFRADDSEDKVTAHMWPIVREIIKTSIENDQNLIIEGCYLPADQVSEFEEEYQKFIIPFYIGFSDHYIECHLHDGIIGHRSETEYKGLEDYNMDMEAVKKANRIQKERCKQHGQAFFEIDTDYRKDLEKAYEWLEGKVCEKKKLSYHEKPGYEIRAIRPEEYDVLEDFLYEAVFQREGEEKLPKDIVKKPELRVYIEDFGRKTDCCLVAVADERVVGAVWTRIIPGYGSIDDQTPEFAISLYKEYRGKGIGTALIKRMLETLKQKGYEKASLAVQKDNYAYRMYKKAGFQTIRETNEEYIMICKLNKK